MYKFKIAHKCYRQSKIDWSKVETDNNEKKLQAYEAARSYKEPKKTSYIYLITSSWNQSV